MFISSSPSVYSGGSFLYKLCVLFFVPLLGRFVVFPSIYNFCALLCYHQDVVFSLYLSVYENHVFSQFNVAIVCYEINEL